MSLTNKARVRKFASAVIVTAIFSFLLVAHAEETPELYALLEWRLEDIGFQLNILSNLTHFLCGILLVGFGSIIGFFAIREVLRIWRS